MNQNRKSGVFALPLETGHMAHLLKQTAPLGNLVPVMSILRVGQGRSGFRAWSGVDGR